MVQEEDCFIMLIQNKLKVYLAPFLHGMRYTSYGRHFTKKEKLQEVCTHGIGFLLYLILFSFVQFRYPSFSIGAHFFDL